MRCIASALLLFVAGTLTLYNVLWATDVLRLASFVGHAADAETTPSSFAPGTEMITSLDQRIHQLTEELTRVKQQQQQLQKQLETHTQTQDELQKHEPQQPHQQQDGMDRLPQCDEVMQAINSPFQDGAFITSHTTPIQWTPRADGSRQLDLNNYICRLKRYTAKEAKQCLASSYQHMSFIGDSLTRYQYVNLAYFLEHDTFPPRFGNSQQPCMHVNESGHETCSPLNQPNICMEMDWRKSIPKEFGVNDQWMYFFSSLGGYSPSGRAGGIMNGRMECSCARSASMKCAGSAPGCGTENQLYTNTNNHGQKFVLSYFKEDGWGNTPNPLHGYNFTNCSEMGTCHLTLEQTQLLVNRSGNFDYDWSQPFPEAINTSGVLRRGDIGLPSQPYIVIYNRGHWGALTKERAKTIMPILFDWVNQDQDTKTTNNKKEKNGGRCFFRSTTRGSASAERSGLFENEFLEVRPGTHEAGCEYLDYAHLTKLFGGFGNPKDWQARERGSVYWDAVHFMPWVYEELNQVLLNVLCNSKKLSEQE